MIMIPETIDIGGITYQVKFTDDMGEGNVGEIRFIDGIITISPRLGDEVAFISFVHEVTHGVMQSLNHFQNSMIYNDENFTEQTAQIMASIIKQIVYFNIEESKK